MITLTNVELSANLYNPVIFFDVNGTKYAIFTNGPEKVMTGDMDGICDELSEQVKMKKSLNKEKTLFRFNDFYIISNGIEAKGGLN
jgi:hypothetical protein